MATVLLHGNKGTVNWTSDAVANTTITAWVIDVKTTVIDTTSMDDDVVGFRTKTPGRKDYTVTVDTLNIGADPTKVANAAASLTLGDSIAGSDLALAKTICTGFSVSLDANDVEKTTFTFVCAGAI